VGEYERPPLESIHQVKPQGFEECKRQSRIEKKKIVQDPYKDCKRKQTSRGS
jgi:hypothetical protein